MSNPKDSEEFDFDFETAQEDDPFADFPEEVAEEQSPSTDDTAFFEAPEPALAKPKAPAAAISRKAPAANPIKSSQPAASGTSLDHRNASLASDLPVQVIAVIGKKTITVKDLISMKKGQVIELNRFPNEAIDLIANGRLMAKGELVEVDGKLGVRIIKIFE